MKVRVIIFLIFLAITTFFSITTNAKEANKMTKDIHWLGHDTFKISGEKIIYTDPFKIKNRDTADIILITHEHRDHCSSEDIKMIQAQDTVIVATPDCVKKISGDLLQGGNIKTVKPGDKISIKGIEIEAVPAYNTNKNFHPKTKEWVGYVFTVNGRRIYIAGDTDYIPEMKTLKNIDIALIPVSGTYVMTADEAVKAALDIKPKIAIPMHYGTIVGSENDAKKFAAALKGKVEVEILKPE
jgi:L-ascorbate metabolism protein UlaG (beta-lactamase superfamily)